MPNDAEKAEALAMWRELISREDPRVAPDPGQRLCYWPPDPWPLRPTPPAALKCFLCGNAIARHPAFADADAICSTCASGASDQVARVVAVVKKNWQRGHTLGLLQERARHRSLRLVTWALAGWCLCQAAAILLLIGGLR